MMSGHPDLACLQPPRLLEKGDVAPEQPGLQPHGLLQRMESCDERTLNTVASLMTAIVEGFVAMLRACSGYRSKLEAVIEFARDFVE